MSSERDKICTLIERITELEAERDGLRTRAEAAEQTVQTMSKEIESLEFQRGVWSHTSKASAIERFQRAEARVTELEEENAKLRSEAACHGDECRIREAASLRARVEEVEKERDALRHLALGPPSHCFVCNSVAHECGCTPNVLYRAVANALASVKGGE